MPYQSAIPRPQRFAARWVAKNQEVVGYQVENVVAATGAEAAQLNLPDGCVMLLA
jgi:hypothetical protein